MTIIAGRVINSSISINIKPLILLKLAENYVRQRCPMTADVLDETLQTFHSSVPPSHHQNVCVLRCIL